MLKRTIFRQFCAILMRPSCFSAGWVALESAQYRWGTKREEADLPPRIVFGAQFACQTRKTLKRALPPDRLRPCLHSPREPRFEQKSPDGRRSAKSVSAIRSSASTHQRAILAETLRDAPILPVRFVAALARCPASRFAVRSNSVRTLPETGKIGSVATAGTIETGSQLPARNA